MVVSQEGQPWVQEGEVRPLVVLPQLGFPGGGCCYAKGSEFGVLPGTTRWHSERDMMQSKDKAKYMPTEILLKPRT